MIKKSHNVAKCKTANFRFVSLLTAFCIYAGLAFGQENLKISGTVTDVSGEPLLGVSVSVKGTASGMTTNLEGAYSLNVPSRNSVLQFTLLGYVSQEVQVGEKTVINIVMAEDSKLLDEVVVVGYGTQKKASLTSAISQISGAEAFKDRGINNVSVAL
ncbi:MAG: carboxypeptidase-like regulatory domain-containing protein, partial [Dysgonamonadaceae bacterium]|nr:carboxypeptidase-like regulatory domain-containing protein [Dysgonamonadaceae bacterium]